MSVNILLGSFQYAHYLDVVEVEFSNQVAQRSAGILQILATFRELHKDVRRACRQVRDGGHFSVTLFFFLSNFFFPFAVDGEARRPAIDRICGAQASADYLSTRQEASASTWRHP